MKHFKTSILASAMCLAASPLCQTASAQIHLTADLHISIPNIDKVEYVPLIFFVGIIDCLSSNGDTKPPLFVFKAVTYAIT